MLADIDAPRWPSPSPCPRLAPGDVVTAFDGIPVARLTDLLQQIGDRVPGDRSRVEVWRRGEVPATQQALLRIDAGLLVREAAGPFLKHPFHQRRRDAAV